MHFDLLRAFPYSRVKGLDILEGLPLYLMAVLKSFVRIYPTVLSMIRPSAVDMFPFKDAMPSFVVKRFVFPLSGITDTYDYFSEISWQKRVCRCRQY